MAAPLTLGGDGTSFTFQGFAHIRVDGPIERETGDVYALASPTPWWHASRRRR